MKALEPDLPYRIDQWIANRPDGGTICDTISESLGVSKTSLHTAMVGGIATAATLKLLSSTNDPALKFFGLLAIVGGGVALHRYLEAPRIRRAVRRRVQRPVRQSVQLRRRAA